MLFVLITYHTQHVKCYFSGFYAVALLEIV